MKNELKLLTPPTSQPKTRKNEKLGYLTAALHLAPANLSGYEVCPGRSPGCTAACLHYAGSPLYMPRKEQARIRRTKWYFEDRPSFLAQLHKEIAALVRKAKRVGLKPAVRLNATSDIPWERVARSLFTDFPDVQFYDYTAVAKRLLTTIPSNYHLTFSAKENNDIDVALAVGAGANIAVVFDREGGLPEYYFVGGRKLPVIDGDETDFRPADPVQCVVGLLVKGARGREDQSGFVRHRGAVLLVA